MYIILDLVCYDNSHALEACYICKTAGYEVIYYERTTCWNGALVMVFISPGPHPWKMGSCEALLVNCVLSHRRPQSWNGHCNKVPIFQWTVFRFAPLVQETRVISDEVIRIWRWNGHINCSERLSWSDMALSLAWLVP